jgi:hypothetical protein
VRWIDQDLSGVMMEETYSDGWFETYVHDRESVGNLRQSIETMVLC